MASSPSPKNALVSPLEPPKPPSLTALPPSCASNSPPLPKGENTAAAIVVPTQSEAPSLLRVVCGVCLRVASRPTYHVSALWPRSSFATKPADCAQNDKCPQWALTASKRLAAHPTQSTCVLRAPNALRHVAGSCGPANSTWTAIVSLWQLTMQQPPARTRTRPAQTGPMVRAAQTPLQERQRANPNTERGGRPHGSVGNKVAMR